jgi:hypothetical protein
MKQTLFPSLGPNRGDAALCVVAGGEANQGQIVSLGKKVKPLAKRLGALFFFTVLGFELGASSFLGRHSTT